MRVLVIEDDPLFRDSLLQMLELEGLEGIGAGDGLSGVQMAQTHAPRLILCDVTLGGIDGFEVVSRLRRDARTSAIPFIFLTARVEEDLIRRALDLGANEYIVKPFSVERLLDTVFKHLKISPSQA